MKIKDDKRFISDQVFNINSYSETVTLFRIVQKSNWEQIGRLGFGCEGCSCSCWAWRSAGKCMKAWWSAVFRECFAGWTFRSCGVDLTVFMKSCLFTRLLLLINCPTNKAYLAVRSTCFTHEFRDTFFFVW